MSGMPTWPANSSGVVPSTKMKADGSALLDHRLAHGEELALWGSPREPVLAGVVRETACRGNLVEREDGMVPLARS